jgi:hypothetical protein
LKRDETKADPLTRVGFFYGTTHGTSTNPVHE